ncbi:MAG: 5'-3' exonuclease H3TH domain-containing protein, partial [Desulfuromusa sp.]|nr:5'-3' exonuclease H3TH domain-containing protein [Desulfuromusa sp.]
MSKATSSPPIILVDGSSYLFRAYHALPKFENSQGHPTGAIRGVISMIRKLISDYPKSKILVVFDAKGKTFRHEMFPDYKANRPPMPEDLSPQISPIHKIVTAMGLPLLVIDDVEADDVIGTLAKEATQKGLETIISTGDKDMAQLVSEHVTLINTMSDTSMDRSGVIEKFGVPPELIIDYLALTGDKVDNIPGVPNCGPKTASKWLNEIGPLQEIINNADKVGGKIGNNLRASLEQLPLSYDLATIKLDVALPESLEDIQPTPPDNKKILAYFKEFEFKSWIKEFEASDHQQVTNKTQAGQPGKATETQADLFESKQDFSDDQQVLSENQKEPFENSSEKLSADAQTIEVNYQTILTEAELENLLHKLRQAGVFAFDTETTSLNYMQAEIVGMSCAIQPGEAFYIPVAHDYIGAPEQLSRQWVLEKFVPLLTDPTVRKIGQNLKYDAHVLANYGIELKGIAEDTMLESYVLNSVGGRHDMDSMAKRYLDYRTTKF